MKTFTTFFVVITLFCSSFLYSQDRGDLITDTLLVILNKSDIQDIYTDFLLPGNWFPIDYDSLEIYKVVYWTIDAHGNDLIEASGLITIPVSSDCDFPLLNYNHGTMVYDKLLSALEDNVMQHFVGVPFAANGYVSVLPDFLGYGETPLDHPHPYLHAKSEATAVVDILRAAREFCTAKDVKLNEQLFLLGYSHGGHVTIATHREIQEFHIGEFEVTASSSGSSAYELSGAMKDSMFLSDYYSNPFYLAFTILSYNFVYGNIFNDITEVFVSPYDSIIPLMLNRYNPESNWRDSLPTPGYQILQPDFRNAIISDSLHLFNVALRDNDVHDWIPQVPIRLYYCEGDEQIPYNNAFLTQSHMLTLGATDVEILSAGATNNHLKCGFPSIVSAKLWFDSFREICSTGVLAVNPTSEINIYPNPFSDVFFINVTKMESVRNLEVRIYDMHGREVHFEYFDQRGVLSVQQGKLTSGNYLVRVITDRQSTSQIILKGK